MNLFVLTPVASRQNLRTLEKEGGGFGPRGGEFGAASSEYSALVQATHAAAGYYRDPRRLEQYVSQASFLPDLNLERPLPAAAGQREGVWERAAGGAGESAGVTAGAGGKAEILKLSKLVLILGERDEASAPPGSAWFQTYQLDDSTQHLVEQKLMDTAVYTRLGLAELDLDGRLLLVSMGACTWQVPVNATSDSWDGCRREVADKIIAHLGRHSSRTPGSRADVA